MYRFLLALLLAPALAGCATVANTLSPEQVAGFRLAAVNVGFAGDARVSWLDGARHYADSKGLDFEGPETQAYIRNAIASKVKAAMQTRLAGQLTGLRPVRVEVVVKSIVVASMVQRVVVGGSHLVMAEVSLVDARTGDILVSHPHVVGAAGAGQGILGVMVDKALLDEPIDRLTESFATQYGRWLLRA
jgi:hypothetical protein